MPRVPWEQRRDKLSGALWVIPVLFMAGAIAVGGLLSLISIGPDSAIAPLLFRGHVRQAPETGEPWLEEWGSPWTAIVPVVLPVAVEMTSTELEFSSAT